MGTKVQPDEVPSAAAAAAGEEDAKKAEAELPKCSYWKLFSNADRFDSLLMAIGIVGSLCNGRWHAAVSVSELLCCVCHTDSCACSLCIPCPLVAALEPTPPAALLFTD